MAAPVRSGPMRAWGPWRARPWRPGSPTGRPAGSRVRRRRCRASGSRAGGSWHRSSSSSRWWRSCTSCCPSSWACATPGAGSSTATPGGSRSPRCSSASRSWATSCCSAACSSATTPGSTGGPATRSRLAGVAATRLFASAGAGGIALTAWALRRSGLEPRIVACRMIAFMAVLYAVFMGSLVIGGLGLYFGVFPGENPFAHHGRSRHLRRRCHRRLPRRVAAARLTSTAWWRGGRHGGRVGRLASQAAALPAAAASGIRTAIQLVRDEGLVAAGRGRVVGL